MPRPAARESEALESIVDCNLYPDADVDIPRSPHNLDSRCLKASRFRLTVRHAISGDLLDQVSVWPDDTVADVSALVLRACGATCGVTLRLIYRNRILQGVERLDEAGICREDAQASAVLVPLVCVTASLDGTARLRQLHTDREVIVDAGGRIYATEIAPGGSTLLTITTLGQGTLWCASTGKRIATLRDRILSCSFSADGHRFCGAADGCSAKIWCPSSGTCMTTLYGHSDVVKNAVFSPDATLVVTCSHDRTARVFDSRDGRCIWALRGHSDMLMSAIFSPDGRQILTASMDASARLWSLETGECDRTFVGHLKTVEAATFSSCGSKVLTTSYDGTLRLWSAATGFCSFVIHGDNGIVRAATLSPDGARILLATGSEDAKVFCSETGDCELTLIGHKDWVRTARWSADGLFIVTASYDGSARIWNALSGDCLKTLSGHTCPIVAVDIVIG